MERGALSPGAGQVGPTNLEQGLPAVPKGTAIGHPTACQPITSFLFPDGGAREWSWRQHKARGAALTRSLLPCFPRVPLH